MKLWTIRIIPHNPMSAVASKNIIVKSYKFSIDREALYVKPKNYQII